MERCYILNMSTNSWAIYFNILFYHISNEISTYIGNMQSEMNEELFSRYDWSFVLRIHRIINSTIPIEMFWPFLTDTIQFVLIEPSRSCIIQIWRLISPNICVGPWTISCNFATMTCRRNRMFWVRTVTNSDKYAPAADPKANIQIQHSDNNGSLATPKEEGTPLFLHNSDNQQF